MAAATATMTTPSLDLGDHSALLSWTLTGQDVVSSVFMDPINDELRDEDVDFSDYESESSCFSPTASPTAMKTTATDAGTPSSVTDVASATAQWPGRPERRKRKRMSDEERKVRHREVQRQFMKRKRARIAELRKVQSGVEKQLRLATVLHEIEMLKKENDTLREQHDAAESSRDSTSTTTSTESSVAPMTFGDLVFSVPKQDEEETHDDVLITDMEWNEIFEVLSDEGDADSDTASQC